MEGVTCESLGPQIFKMRMSSDSSKLINLIDNEHGFPFLWKTQEIICECDTEKVRSSTPISIIWEFSNADKQKKREKIKIRKLKLFIVLP